MASLDGACTDVIRRSHTHPPGYTGRLNPRTSPKRKSAFGNKPDRRSSAISIGAGSRNKAGGMNEKLDQCLGSVVHLVTPIWRTQCRRSLTLRRRLADSRTSWKMFLPRGHSVLRIAASITTSSQTPAVA